MDIIPFINSRGLWQLDMPELLDPNNFSVSQLMLVELGIVTILDTLSANVFKSLNLEFHYLPIHPHDAHLIKEGTRYKCVSLMKKDMDFFVWFPPHVFKAMKTNNNPDRIYIRINNVMV